MGEPGNWFARRGRVQEIGDGVEGLDEVLLFRGAEADGVPSIHLAGVEQCAANGGLRNESLHAGGEDFGDLSIFLRIEDILHSPQIQGVVPVENEPDKTAQMLTTVAVGIVANAGAQVLRGLPCHALTVGPEIQFSLGLE